MSSPAPNVSVRCDCGRKYETGLAALLCHHFQHQVLGVADPPDAEFTQREVTTGQLARPADWPGATDSVELSEYVHPDVFVRETHRSYDNGLQAGRGYMSLLALWAGLAAGFVGGLLVGLFIEAIAQWIR
jgi:hypothetical protein